MNGSILKSFSLSWQSLSVQVMVPFYSYMTDANDYAANVSRTHILAYRPGNMDWAEVLDACEKPVEGT